MIGAKVALTIILMLAKIKKCFCASGFYLLGFSKYLILNHFELNADGFFGGYTTANFQFRDRRLEFLQMQMKYHGRD